MVKIMHVPIPPAARTATLTPEPQLRKVPSRLRLPTTRNTIRKTANFPTKSLLSREGASGVERSGYEP